MNTVLTSTSVSEELRLPAHPPHASALDRAAMRIGLRLLLWGARRSLPARDDAAAARHLLAARLRAEHERADAHAAQHRVIR